MIEARTYRVAGLDCAEEVEALKATVGSLPGVERLDFNLLNATLTVTAGVEVTPALVAEAARRAGLTATVDAPGQPDTPSLWQRHGRLITFAAALAALTTGLVVHVAAHGPLLHALADSEAPGHETPPAALAAFLLAMILGGWHVIPKAVAALLSRRPDMNLLMTIAVIGATALGQWFEAACVAVLFALALLLESWSVARARQAIRALTHLSPPLARYVCPHDGDIMEGPVEAVAVGTLAIVHPGERVPLDGVVVEGATTINEAPLTGESSPVPKSEGSEVFAGTINHEGVFRFRVTRQAADTTLARIIRMVEEAQSRRAPLEHWVDRFARRYTPAMVMVAAAVAVLPPLMDGHWHAWFYQSLVVLLIACPCALVIATPVGIVAGLTAAARAGVLIKGGAYLEAAARVQAVALDKTGTLTQGRPEVQAVLPFEGHTLEDILAAAAALESASDHPVARAIRARATAAGLPIPAATGIQALPGKGLVGTIDGRAYWLGNHRLMHERGAETPAVHAEAERLEGRGHSVVAIGTDHHVCGLMTVADTLRPDAPTTVQALKAHGVQRVVMLTGDNAGTAAAVAGAVGVDAWQAELLPSDKLRAIHDLARDFGTVAMVGDGVNDAPAMAASTLGIAMGTAGTDAAIETADIALMADDLSRLPWLIAHARRVLSTLRTNIAFALGLKAGVMALSFAGYASLWMAIAADMGASLIVVAWSLRLLRP